MLLRDLPVRDVMVTDVLTFRTDDNVQDAMRALVLGDIDGAPVVDDDGAVVGLLSTGDLIVEEARLHLPTVITLLGAVLELPSSKRRFEDDLEKALGATVGEVMSETVSTVGPDDTFETAATVMHEENQDRLPVVDGSGVLVGIIARGDIVRAIVRDADARGSHDVSGG